MIIPVKWNEAESFRCSGEGLTLATSASIPFWGSQCGRVVTLAPLTSVDPGSNPGLRTWTEICRSQSDSEGFSRGTPVYLPQQNRLPADSIWLWCCARRSCMDRIWGQAHSWQHSSFNLTSLSCTLCNSVSDCKKGWLACQVWSDKGCIVQKWVIFNPGFLHQGNINPAYKVLTVQTFK